MQNDIAYFVFVQSDIPYSVFVQSDIAYSVFAQSKQTYKCGNSHNPMQLVCYKQNITSKKLSLNFICFVQEYLFSYP